jgi:hypothetical protein
MRTRKALNLSLWGEDPFRDVAGNARLNWSYSRRESVDQCLRRYFYQYYGGCIPDAALRAEVKSLREIKNRHLRTGELLHLAVGTYFKKKKLGTDLPSNWLQSWVRKLFAADQQYSLSIRSGGARSTEQYPPTLLDEILLAEDSGDELRAATDQLIRAIQRFFADDVFKPFRILGSKQGSLIEHKLSLTGYPVPVSGKLDLAAEDGNSVTIVDWKLGCASDGGAESLQLATYGLWAQATYNLPAEQIRIVKAHLSDGAVVDFKADDEAFANARVRIHQDLERMSILHGYGEAGTVDAFTPLPHAKVCRLCPYRKICPEGKKHD